MNAFLSHDWAGLPIALIALLAGYLLFRLGRGRSSKLARWPLVIIGALGLVLGAVLFGGAALHVYTVQKLSSANPPPGKLYDVGGYRLHIMTAGENRVTPTGRTPTVILTGGGYSQGLTMHHLFKDLSADTRTIIFDRAGTGWSERSPEPRTIRNDVRDLKKLLDAAGEEGPFIVSGHSWGGFFSLNFAGLYPEDTAGIVLLDSTPPSTFTGEAASGLTWFGSYLKTQAILKLFSLDGWLGSLGGGAADPESPDFIYKPIRDVFELMATGEAHTRSGISAAESFFDNLANPDAMVKSPGELGDIPLIVLNRDPSKPEAGQATPEQQQAAKEQGMKVMKLTSEEYDQMMVDGARNMTESVQAMVELSRDHELVFAPEGSTHQFPYEHPDFCEKYIRQMIARTSGASPAAGSGGRNSASAQLQSVHDRYVAEFIDQDIMTSLMQGKPVEAFARKSLEQAHQETAVAAELAAELAGVDATALTYQEQLTLKMLDQHLRGMARSADFYWLNFDITPYIGGWTLQAIPAALNAARIDSPEQLEKFMRLLDSLGLMLGDIKSKLDGQVQRVIYLPKAALPAIRNLLDVNRAIIADALEIADERLADLGSDAAAAQARIQAEVNETILPAYDAIVERIGPEYENQAPEKAGLGQYPGGAEYYQYQIENFTSLPLTAADIHQKGLDYLAGLQQKMQTIRDELGFTGTAAEFHAQLQQDPRFFDKTPADVETRFMRYIAKIEPHIKDYFAVTPKAPYGVKRLDESLEEGMTFGYYQPPGGAETVGNYRYNGSKLDQRPLIWAGPLIYHELVPGHHFHLALQRENEELPRVRKFGSLMGSGAFTEGWANYGALLAVEMGLLDEPYDRYGWLLFDSFISMRLVVDTGLNAMGWSLEQARQFIADNTIQSQAEAFSETLRYSSDMPAQALMYKLGFEAILAARAEQQARLGEQFDIRKFNTGLIGYGALPPNLISDHMQWYMDESRFPAPAYGGRRLHSTTSNFAHDPSGPVCLANLPNQGRQVACGSSEGPGQ